MGYFRLLITGSRDWSDGEFVRDRIIDEISWFVEVGDQVVVVHGACPTGADEMASRTVRWLQESDWPIIEERHPADWDNHGKRAGFIRNDEMVRIGADLCLAFQKYGSRGTQMTIDLAQKAEIPTKVYKV